MHGQTQVEVWISSVFCVLFVVWGTKIDGNGVPGPVRDQVGTRAPKKTPKWSGFGLDLTPVGALFRVVGVHFGGSFSVCFWNISFSPLGWHSAAQGAGKGGKRDPRVMKKEVLGHPLEHAKTMAGTVREAYREVPGRVQETLFAARGAKASPEGSRGGSKRIFHDFGCPLGLPWVVILREIGCLFCIGFLHGKTIK